MTRNKFSGYNYYMKIKWRQYTCVLRGYQQKVSSTAMVYLKSQDNIINRQILWLLYFLTTNTTHFQNIWAPKLHPQVCQIGQRSCHCRPDTAGCGSPRHQVHTASWCKIHIALFPQYSIVPHGLVEGSCSDGLSSVHQRHTYENKSSTYMGVKGEGGKTEDLRVGRGETGMWRVGGGETGRQTWKKKKIL